MPRVEREKDLEDVHSFSFSRLCCLPVFFFTRKKKDLEREVQENTEINISNIARGPHPKRRGTPPYPVQCLEPGLFDRRPSVVKGGRIQNKTKKENWGGPKWGSKKLRGRNKKIGVHIVSLGRDWTDQAWEKKENEFNSPSGLLFCPDCAGHKNWPCILKNPVIFFPISLVMPCHRPIVTNIYGNELPCIFNFIENQLRNIMDRVKHIYPPIRLFVPGA